MTEDLTKALSRVIEDQFVIEKGRKPQAKRHGAPQVWLISSGVLCDSEDHETVSTKLQ